MNMTNGKILDIYHNFQDILERLYCGKDGASCLFSSQLSLLANLILENQPVVFLKLETCQDNEL